jgi:hypothetical protein
MSRQGCYGREILHFSQASLKVKESTKGNNAMQLSKKQMPLYGLDVTGQDSI